MSRGRVVVLLLAALLFFWQLGGHDLWAPDEPYFAEGAREMVHDGNWAVPHVNGKITTDKPPLFFWLIALFSLPIGTVTEFTARLPSALAGLGTIALIMRLGNRFAGPRTAALAGFVLSTTFLFWEKARWSQTDSVLCFLIWVALSAFEAHRSGEVSGRRAGLLFWLAAALAVLDKGPVGFLLPLGIALVVLAFDRDLGRWRTFAPYTGPLLFAVVIGAWMIFSTVGSGGEYSVWGALKEHFIDRGVHGMHHRQPFWYFGEVLPPNLLPWTGLVPGALVLAWRRRLASDRFLFVVAIFVIAFFTISTEKRELYALPALPAIALMVAGFVGHVCGWDQEASGPALLDRRWFTFGQAFTSGLFTILGIALPFVARRNHDVPADAYGVATLLGILFFASGAVAIILLSKRRAFGAALSPAIAIAVAYLIAVTAIYPTFESRKSGRTLAERLDVLTAESRESGIPVLAFEIENVVRPIAFYSEGLYTVETSDPKALMAHLTRSEPAWAVVDGNRIGQLPESFLANLFVVEETRLSRQPILVLTNHPHPEGTSFQNPLPEDKGREEIEKRRRAS